MTSPILASPPHIVAQVYSQGSRMAQHSVWDCLGQAVSLGVPGQHRRAQSNPGVCACRRMPVESQQLFERLPSYQPGKRPEETCLLPREAAAA